LERADGHLQCCHPVSQSAIGRSEALPGKCSWPITAFAASAQRVARGSVRTTDTGHADMESPMVMRRGTRLGRMSRKPGVPGISQFPGAWTARTPGRPDRDAPDLEFPAQRAAGSDAGPAQDLPDARAQPGGPGETAPQGPPGRARRHPAAVAAGARRSVSATARPGPDGVLTGHSVRALLMAGNAFDNVASAELGSWSGTHSATSWPTAAPNPGGGINRHRHQSPARS
jgi:hypothetical protein